jgi:putative ABC transport system permease protein
MLIRDIFTFAFDALKERKLRAALTILGIAIGPAAIVALIGATEGFSQAVSAQFDKMGVTTISVMPVGRGVTLTATDVETLQKIEGVKYVIPYFSVRTTLRYGGTTTSASVVALDLTKLELLFPDIKVINGSMPTSSELTSALIGFSLANPADPETPPIQLYQVVTASLQGGTSKSFLVKGVLSEFGQGLFINPDDTVFIPFESGRLLTGRTQYTGVYVIASTREVVNEVTNSISSIYGNSVRILTVSSILSTIQSITGSMSTILASIASISVVVAFMGIMTSMFTSVYERTREIGVAKAIGYTNTSILLFFLGEAVLTGFIGGTIGSAAGAVFSNFLLSLFSGGIRFGGPGGFGGAPPGVAGQAARTTVSASTLQITPVITPQLLLLAILLATAVGALAGLVPAWRASRLTPVEALRHE